MDIATLLGLIAVLLLVLANGFFVASEFALVSVRRSRIDQRANEGDTKVLVVQRSLDHLDGAIAATQLGITMASLALGWIGEPALAHLIEPLFHLIPFIDSTIGSHTIAVALSFAIITALHIVLGELAPKTLAFRSPRQPQWSSPATRNLLARFPADRSCLERRGQSRRRAFGLRPAGHENVHSVEELELLVQSSAQAGILNSDEAELLGRVFEFGERSVRQIMTPG